MVCASCLAKLTVKKTTHARAWAWAPRLGLALLAAAVVYFTLLLIGNMLLSIPSHFHASGGW